MAAKVTSIGLKGLEGYRVSVEVQTIEGPNSIKIVGLPDASVQESKERITAAFHSLGYTIFHKKIIVNLSPSEQKKNGPLFDMPIAIAILMSLNVVPAITSEETGFLGALSLDGGIQTVEGILPAILAAKQIGMKKLYIPVDDTLPNLDFEGMEIRYATNLIEVVEDLTSKKKIPIHEFVNRENGISKNYPGFEQIIGQNEAKRVLEIAAAGGHHVFMTGPPGCGKSMLAESFPSILPALSKDKWFEVVSIYQLNGLAYKHGFSPPYRSPHHSASSISLIGGGQTPRPGEISLAHRGVLFLDEIAEFGKNTLEMLRQPLETGKITISRVRSTVSYPSSFILIGAMNPCPCGYYGSNTHYCTCSPKQITSYQNRISGPIRDRFDIFLSMKPVDFSKSKYEKKESSAAIRMRIERARQQQYERYGEEICNSRIPYETMLSKSPLTKQQQNHIQKLSLKHHWSNRTQIKIIKIARTITDLQQEEQISDQNITEAIKLNSGKL
jgi:magnesium chelatase family protein